MFGRITSARPNRKRLIAPAYCVQPIGWYRLHQNTQSLRARICTRTEHHICTEHYYMTYVTYECGQWILSRFSSRLLKGASDRKIPFVRYVTFWATRFRTNLLLDSSAIAIRLNHNRYISERSNRKNNTKILRFLSDPSIICIFHDQRLAHKHNDFARACSLPRSLAPPDTHTDDYCEMQLHTV